jgi:glycosyltransferase involved in cell wall biosynthesis
MTILHLTTFLQGGAGRVVVDLASRQRRQGHTVTVVASDTASPGYRHYDDYITELADAGVPVWLVDSLFHREPAANLRAVALVTRLGRTAPPDVMHTHAAVPSLVALLAAGHARRAVRIVQTMHGWGLAKSAAQADCDVRVMNLVDRIVVPSAPAAADLRALGVDPALLSVVPYGVGPDRAVLIGDDAALASDLARRRRQGTFVLCCVGTIGARKNQALLVEALARLGPTPDVFTLFVGDGEGAALSADLTRAGLGTRTRVVGYTPAARAFARAADALVLPSMSEGQPLAVLEAFADRTLVVASDIPALTALVRDGVTGLLHRSGDARSLAKAIARATRLPPLDRARLVARAELLYVDAFTTEAMHQHYMDAYQAVARGPVGLRRAG